MFGIYHRASNKFLSDEEINQIGLYCRPNGDVYIKLLDSLILAPTYAAGARQRLESVSYLEMSVMADRIERRLAEIDERASEICRSPALSGVWWTLLDEHYAQTGEESERLKKRLAILKANMNETSKTTSDILA